MTDMPDAYEIVTLIRKQNWKLGGALIIDTDEAVALVEQAFEVMRSEGERQGMERMHASHMRTFDAAITAGQSTE